MNERTHCILLYAYAHGDTWPVARGLYMRLVTRRDCKGLTVHSKYAFRFMCAWKWSEQNKHHSRSLWGKNSQQTTQTYNRQTKTGGRIDGERRQHGDNRERLNIEKNQVYEIWKEKRWWVFSNIHRRGYWNRLTDGSDIIIMAINGISEARTVEAQFVNWITDASK